VKLFILQLRGELQKLFARKRTYIGFGAFLLVEALVLTMIQLPKPKAFYRRMIEDSGFAFDQYFSGLTLGFVILTTTSFLLGSLFLALIAGDVVSKEVEEGTLRMMLCRPVSRARIIALKFVACAIYTFALVFFIGITGLLAGAAIRGLGGLFVLAQAEHIFALYEFREGLLRYLAALPLLTLSLMSITSLGFMLSCFNMKPAAASIVTLSLLFLDWIFHNMPYFESLQPWFLTTHMAAWLDVFQHFIPWPKMIEDYVCLLAIDATFVVIGLASFQQRDFKA
jgi:ABC-2 type transport system permease protein